jgi:hypothetical protein
MDTDTRVNVKVGNPWKTGRTNFERRGIWATRPWAARSDFSGNLRSLRKHMREEISAFTVEKHISMLNQWVIKNLRGKLRKLRTIFWSILNFVENTGVPERNLLEKLGGFTEGDIMPPEPPME